MAIGSWNPEDKASDYVIDNNLLERFIQYAEKDQLNELENLLSPEEQQQHAQLMLLPSSDWLAASESMNGAELTALIKFFTVAEQLPGWFAGERSPVISLAKQLKKQQGIERELIAWIRAHSENRFLPYGPL